MQNPSNTHIHKEKREHARRTELLKRLRSVLLENWGAKLLALCIAVAMWAGLITQDPSLTREKQFTGVTVNVNGAETLKRNGYIILEDVYELLDNVAVRVSVPQAQYAAAQASNYSIRVDLSRIHGTGTQEVKILSTNSSIYGTVTEIVPSTVKLTVDEYVTRYRIPVTISTQGLVPEGFYATAPSTDPPMIAVSGPKTVVERIVSAQVVADQTTLPAREEAVRRALPFTLVDENGAAISSDLLEVTSESVLLDSIIVEQKVYAQQTAEVSDLGLVTGQPAEGYEVKGVYITPSTVTIAGHAAEIRDIEQLYTESTVDIRGRTESISRSLRVRQPSSVVYASAASVTVAVEIGPVITSRAYEAQVLMQGLPAALQEAGGIRSATIHLTGPQPWLDGLGAAAVRLTCDLSRISQPGTYTLPLLCEIAGNEGQNYTVEINPANVVVTVLER